MVSWKNFNGLSYIIFLHERLEISYISSDEIPSATLYILIARFYVSHVNLEKNIFFKKLC